LIVPLSCAVRVVRRFLDPFIDPIISKQESLLKTMTSVTRTNTKLFNIINKAGSAAALDVVDNALEDGAAVGLYTLHNEANQRWIVSEPDTEGYVTIAVDLPGRDLHLTATSDGAVILSSFTSTGTTSSSSGGHSGIIPDLAKWRIIPSKFVGFSTIVNKDNGHALDNAGGRGCDLCTWDVHGQDNQLWRLTETTSGQFPFLEDSRVADISCEFAAIGEPTRAAFEASMKEILAEYGVVIINNVLDAAEIDEAAGKWGEDLMALTDHAACQAATDRYPYLKTAYDGFQSAPLAQKGFLWPGREAGANNHGLPQGKFSWHMRLHPHIKGIYSAIYNGQDLVAGMDPPFYSPPNSAKLFEGEKRPQTEIWGHADHNANMQGTQDWDVYQSVVSVTDTTDLDDWTTVAWLKSHTTIFPYLTAAVRKAITVDHFVLLDYLRDPVASEQYVREARRLRLTKGSMLIWNSRAIHQGSMKGPRFAMPVCWEPRVRRTPGKVFNRKLRIAASGKPSTHWASLGKVHPGGGKFVPTPVRIYSDPTVVEFPRVGKIRSYALKDDASIDEVESLVQRLIASDDKDEEAAISLIELLKPEIVAAL
jgi:Ricin-type beta-trefoil lectin domain-like